jgi:hypothetical protein
MYLTSQKLDAYKVRIVLVHGCWNNSSTRKLEKSLVSTANSIGVRITHCRRVHIFGYNAAKLLLGGQSMFHELSNQLLLDLNTISVGKFPSMLILLIPPDSFDGSLS